ncbi:MAG: FAD-linked oxidoreductase [Nocardioides sp.]|nr:FAD-linked oxidoreductase [Nocardioides sp.]
MTATRDDLRTGFDDLASQLRGDLILPDQQDYDDARAVYNGMIDKRPAAIARCLVVDDVRACVGFARENNVDLAVRGGGHNAGGLGVWDDALVVDLSRMRSVEVASDGRTVRVAGGCTWADVDAATVEHGAVTPSGIVSSTGVGGLALGGGIGYHTRLLGLTVDNLVSAQVVLADGRVVTASDSSEPDLFWALRGGGGNFGVVTEFEFRCHPVGDHGTIIGGPVLYDLADAGDMLRWYRDRLPGLPRDLNAWAGVGSVPGGPPFPEEIWGREVGLLVWCYDGPHDDLDTVLAPTREFGSPLMYGVGPMPFPMLHSAFNELYPPGLQWYWRADFFTEITDEAIAKHIEHAARMPSALSTMHLYPIDGAAADVAESETAFAYRDGGWSGVFVGVDPDPVKGPALASWTREYQEALHPTSAGGAYVNFMMDEGEDRVRAAYRGNYERLARVKRSYDPDNLFHVNQNIRPASG